MNETMMNALAALFEKHRIVFWYCEDPLLVADFEACTMPTVEKRDITGHPLATKVEVLLERPKDKFLLFCHVRLLTCQIDIKEPFFSVMHMAPP